MIKDVEQTIRAYLPQTLHMSLATCAGGAPWVCEVRFAYDDELYLYFRSLPDRRHSTEIAANPRVAGNIVTQHALGERPRGVYFEGIAELLEDVGEEHPAYLCFRERFGAVENERKGFYRITVATYYLFDGRESSPSTKYALPWGTRS